MLAVMNAAFLLPVRTAAALLLVLMAPPAPAAAPDPLDARLRSHQALALYQQGSYVAARAEWRALAVWGDAEAACNFAFMLANGLGGPADRETAARYYAIAAGFGDAPAQVALGCALADAKGVPENAG